MAKKDTMNVQGTEITIISQQEKGYICITDIAKYKSGDPAGVIGSWMRNRYHKLNNKNPFWEN